MRYCDRLVVLDTSDQAVNEPLELFMPKDKLVMTFDIRLNLAVPPDSYEFMYSKLQPSPSSENSYVYYLNRNQAYKTYGQNVIRTVAREYLSQFTISEVASNLEAINAELAVVLSEKIKEKTPFAVRHVGLAKVTYPPLIITAQEKAAERREAIQQEEAQLEISKVSLERELQEAKLQRAIDVEQAEAEAEVNKILANSVNASYKTYRLLQALDKIAESENAKFIPVGMLDSMAGQVMLGGQK